MNWHELTLEPRDTLFFRDARPMSGGGIGQGAQWPLPHTLHGALHTALYRAFPERQSGETNWRRPQRKTGRISQKHTELRFGNLRTVGPFPVLENETLVPTPKDLVMAEEADKAEIGFKPVELPEGWQSDLPGELQWPVARTGKPSKAVVPGWIPLSEMLTYLEGKPVELVSSSELWDVERNVGIAINDLTGATESGRLYQAEKLRPRPGVQLRAFAALAGGGPDFLEEAFKNQHSILFGGESSGVVPSALRQSPSNTPMELDGPIHPAWAERGDGKTLYMTLKSRLMVNMAGGVIENGNLSLHPLTGHPVIPGSAVKGVARHAARETWREENDPPMKIIYAKALADVFGYPTGEKKLDTFLIEYAPDYSKETRHAGSVIFLDAHPLDRAPLEEDILTPHTTNDPKPNVFPAVAAGATFVFALLPGRRLATFAPEHRQNLKPGQKNLPRKFSICSAAAARTPSRKWTAP